MNVGDMATFEANELCFKVKLKQGKGCTGCAFEDALELCHEAPDCAGFEQYFKVIKVRPAHGAA